MAPNTQRRVTDRGLETIRGAAPDYWIDAGKLVETRLKPDGLIYERFVDLGVKNWLIPDDLEAAFDEALAAHATRLPLASLLSCS